MSTGLHQALTLALKDPAKFSRFILNRTLRPYQIEPAAAIIESITRGLGLTFVVEMSRQAGKNELSACLEAYLLTLYQRVGGQIVKASPTFKPQTVNSLNRLNDRLKGATALYPIRFKPRAGYIIQVGKARALFFSADRKASTVGATADLLLEGDEAQDIRQSKWDKDFEPMRASTNATNVLWGTAWTKNTLLAQTRLACERQQAKDGKRRVFLYPCDEVARCVPAYARHVAERIERLGRNHPLIKTQYFLEEIDAAGGLFSESNKALMRGTHARARAPEPGHEYAVLIDVAGGDEAATESDQDLDRSELANKKRDAHSINVVEIVRPKGEAPKYLKRDAMFFLGIKHTELYDRINAIIELWGARWVVVDATGIGAGLTSFLSAKWKERVIPFEFSSSTKSDLGWDFLGIVETGRFKDFADDGSVEYLQFWHEVDKCEKDIKDGPEHRLAWGVWEPCAYDGVIAQGHDDLLIATAFVAVLDRQPRPTEYTPAQVQTVAVRTIAKRRSGKY